MSDLDLGLNSTEACAVDGGLSPVGDVVLFLFGDNLVGSDFPGERVVRLTGVGDVIWL